MLRRVPPFVRSTARNFNETVIISSLLLSWLFNFYRVTPDSITYLLLLYLLPFFTVHASRSTKAESAGLDPRYITSGYVARCGDEEVGGKNERSLRPNTARYLRLFLSLAPQSKQPIHPSWHFTFSYHDILFFFCAQGLERCMFPRYRTTGCVWVCVRQVPAYIHTYINRTSKRRIRHYRVLVGIFDVMAWFLVFFSKYEHLKYRERGVKTTMTIEMKGGDAPCLSSLTFVSRCQLKRPSPEYHYFI